MRMLYVAGVLSLFLATRLPGLGFDMLNSDGIRWHRRSEKFMSAINHHDFAATYQHYQPGVTLMWLNSITKKVVWEIQDLRQVQRWSLENSDDFPKIHAVSKATLVLVLSGLLVYQLLVISKLFSAKTAVLYGLLVATEPYLMGIDRWFHLTSLEAYLAFSAYLTYLYSLKRRRKTVYMAVGFLTALAVLSKLSSIVVLPLILLTELIYGLRTKEYGRSIVASLIVVLVFASTTFTLFPALWVNLEGVVNKLANAVTLAVESDVRGHYFEPPFTYIYYLLILAYKLSPGILMAFFGSVTFFISQISKKEKPQNYFVLAYLLTFILVLTLSAKKIDRYAVALIQPLILFTVLYIKQLKKKFLIGFISFHILSCGFFYWCNFPVFSGYYSPIAGGVQVALDLGIYENSGEFFSQAATYVSRFGRGVVYIPDNYESFKYFYNGGSVNKISSDARYMVASLDFDRQSPITPFNCSKLERSFGPKFTRPVVYVFSCSF